MNQERNIKRAHQSALRAVEVEQQKVKQLSNHLARKFKELRQQRMVEVGRSRLMSAQSQYHQDLQNVESLGNTKEQEIARLEQIEAGLLDRIKNTQTMHQKVH